MRLILKENSFKFNGKHYLQTHGIAMDIKMAVAFAVITTVTPGMPTQAYPLEKIYRRHIFSVDSIQARNQRLCRFC